MTNGSLQHQPGSRRECLNFIALVPSLSLPPPSVPLPAVSPTPPATASLPVSLLATSPSGTPVVDADIEMGDAPEVSSMPPEEVGQRRVRVVDAIEISPERSLSVLPDAEEPLRAKVS